MKIRVLWLIGFLLIALGASQAKDKEESVESVTFEIEKVTLAVTNAEQMKTFYETVFGIELTAIERFGATFYEGEWLGMKLLMCPNELAGVDARQNRQQFDIKISELDPVFQAVHDGGGHFRNEPVTTEFGRVATAVDPDGNTIVFIEYNTSED